jgi:hypothetical protein
MLRKKEVFTIITPIPGFIPRQLAIDILHSHSEVITLNPLVLDHKPIPAPRDAQSDEFYSTWYEITERIQYVPGLGKMGSGTIKFNGCFHDMPWGLQTHIYAPLNVDLRNKYRIAGNQSGYEPPEAPEIGLKALGAPADGLYLREDIEIKCNVAVVGFVKAQLQKAGGEMVSRIIKKAELLDAGVLHAMIENGKLKTINPADRSKGTNVSPLPSPSKLPNPMSPSMPYQIPRPVSYQPQHPGQGQYGYPQGPTELAGSTAHAPQTFVSELAGDYYHPQVSPRLAPPYPGSGSPSLHSNRDSAMSGISNPSPDPSQSGRWSATDPQSQIGSRPTSLGSDATSVGGMRSPGLDNKGFASELSTHTETHEEHRDDALRKLDPHIPQPSHYPPYNPADYAKVSRMTPPPGQHPALRQHTPNYTQ